jgi:hypothetical protein
MELPLSPSYEFEGEERGKERILLENIPKKGE